MSSWKLGNGWVENWRAADRGVALTSCNCNLVAHAVCSAPRRIARPRSGRNSDRGDGRLAVEKWKAAGGRWADYGRLLDEQGRTAERLKAATEKNASLRSALDEALYDGQPADAIEAKLDKSALELRAASFRSDRLKLLVPAAQAACREELRGQLEAERRRLSDLLTLEMNGAAADLAGACQSYAGQWFIKSEALRRVMHVSDKDRVILDAIP